MDKYKQYILERENANLYEDEYGFFSAAYDDYLNEVFLDIKDLKVELQRKQKQYSFAAIGVLLLILLFLFYLFQKK